MGQTLNSALEEYYHRRQGRYSASTWEAHVQQLEKFRRWITARSGVYVPLEDVDDRLVTDYFRSLRARARPVASSTHNNYRQMVRMFFAFCLGESWIKTDPARHIDLMPVRKRVRLQLSPAELTSQRFLGDATPRDRIALAVGMNTGLRAQDVMKLKVGDAALDAGYLSAWVEKTDTEERLPITQELHNELIRWFHHYGGVMGVKWDDLPNEWTLIPPVQRLANNPWEPDGPWFYRYETGRTIRHPELIVQRGLQRLGHPTKGEGFHTLRRSAARAVHDMAAADPDSKSTPIRIAQAMCGHKNQATTETYLGLTVERLARDDLLRGRSFLTRASGAASSPAVPVVGVG